MLKWLLIFTPIAIALEYLAPERHLLVFTVAAIAILPLAGWMGNATELIIALAALRAGLHDVVKASIVGSIVGDILLVLGAAMLASGIRHEEQHFNAAGGTIASHHANARSNRVNCAGCLSCTGGRARSRRAGGPQRLDIGGLAHGVRHVSLVFITDAFRAVRSVLSILVQEFVGKFAPVVCHTLNNQIQSKPISAKRSNSTSAMLSNVAGRLSRRDSFVSQTRVLIW